MYFYINLLFLLFWITLFLFLFNIYNLFILILLSELIWILLYNLSLVFSIYLDNLFVLLNSIFILNFASIEFSLGFFLIFYFYKYKIIK